ncbi:MAG: FlgD immunoglobulin-like domain containing protein, partial [Ignavibacteriaceae bacterium]
DLNKTFSPWSNPSACNSSGTLSDIAVEVLPTSGSTLDIQYFIGNPLYASPSNPTDIVTHFNSSTQTVTSWTANQETDLRAYYLYRQFYYLNDDGTEHNISETSLGGGISGTSKIDNFGTLPSVPPGKVLYLRYKVQSNDNNGNFSLKASGNSLGFLPSTISTGSNITIGGENVALGNVGVFGTLNVSPGASIKFYNNSSLVIYSGSNFNATGTANNMITFDFISKSNNGIKFQVEAGGTLEYCNIKNAYYGVYCTSTGNPNVGHNAPSIQYCNINHNNYGIYYYYSGIPTHSPTHNTIQYNTYDGIYLYITSPQSISWNTIRNNGRYGLYCYYGQPRISNNTFSNNGIYCYNTSGYNGVFPYINYNTISNAGDALTCNSNSKCNLLSSPSGYGYNTITNAFYALVLNYSSTIYANNGYNSIYNNEISIYARNNSVANVTYNCWDESSPRMLVSGGSIVNWYPSLGPCGGGSLAKISSGENSTVNSSSGSDSTKSGDFVIDDELLLALQYMLDGKYDDAISLYYKRLKNGKDINEKKYTLSQIAECYRRGSKDNFIDFLDNKVRTSSNGILSKSDELYAESLELENIIHVNEGKIDKAIENLNVIKSTFSKNENIYKHALFNLVNLNFFENNLAEAEENLAEMRKYYTDDKLTNIAETLLEGKNENGSEKINKMEVENKTSAEVPKEFALLGNYPNPFNPSTSISYNLPKISSIEIEIYDILGHKVKEFYITSQSAGTQSVIWNGTNNNNEKVSSGIYLYHLKAISLEGKQDVFEKTAKLLLLK